MKALLFCITSALLFTGCDGRVNSETSTQIERRGQEQLSLQAIESVGMPAVTKFAEKRMMKTIIELRDKEVATTTYIVDLNGRLHKICNSVGYGLPYATQYTNPQRVAKYTETPEHGNVTLPQADPNGLYSPAAADGTWVMCVNPTTKFATPMYIEPRVIVSPFPLAAVE